MKKVRIIKMKGAFGRDESEKTLITIVRVCAIIFVAGILSLAVIMANAVRQELKIEEIRKELDEWEKSEVLIENKIWDEKLPRN